MEKKDSSYNQILKTTSIFGSSQVVNILIGFIRIKIAALLLGPIGIGLIGIYQSVIDTIRSMSGLGIEVGSIREIAQVGNNKESLDKKINILKQCITITACLGALICLSLCYPISIWIFDNTDYWLAIALLSVAIFFTSLKLGFTAILQGMRKISFMAKATICESIFGLFIIIPTYFFFGIDGVIPVFILNSIIAFVCIKYFYNKLQIKNETASSEETFRTGLSILRLGIFVTLGTIINAVSMLLIRIYISNTLDMVAVGIFQSAWSIISVYTSLILGATGTDYFPRLCKIAEDKAETQKLVNEQSYVVLSIAAPIIIGMLSFSSFVIYILYSKEFADAQGVLQWQIIGTYFKILASPIAYILLAKNKGKLYLLSEILFFVTYLLISYLLLPQYGVVATGIGYMVAYIAYIGIIFIAGYNISDFKWNKVNLKMIMVNLLFIAIAAYIMQLDEYKLIFGSFLLILSLIYAYKKLREVFTLEELKDWFRKK